jgi:hypothetical protein
MTLIYLSAGSWIMLEPWNPHIAVPFFVLFVFQSWLLATGEARVLPGAVFVGTFLVQTHVGYAPLVGVAAVTVLAFALLDTRTQKRDSGWSIWRRPVWISSAIAFVLWLPVLIEQITSSRGNLSRLADYFRGGNAEPIVGFAAGLRLMSAEFRVLPSWLGGTDHNNAFTGAASEASPMWLLIPVALLGVGLIVSRRRAGPRRFLVLAGALLLTGVVTLTRVTGVPYPYLFLWRAAVAVLVVFAVGWAIADATQFTRWRYATTSCVVAAFVVVALGSGGLAWSIIDHPADVSPFEPATKKIASELERRGVPPGGVILRIDTVSLIALQRGVFDELDRSGMSVSVDDSLDYQFGNRRGAAPGDVELVWWVAENGRSLAYLSSLPGAKIVARANPLPRNEENEALRLQRTILSDLEAAGREDLAPKLDSPFVTFALGEVPEVDRGNLDRLAELNAKVIEKGGCRCGVVAMRPDLAPADLYWLS